MLVVPFEVVRCREGRFSVRQVSVDAEKVPHRVILSEAENDSVLSFFTACETRLT